MNNFLKKLDSISGPEELKKTIETGRLRLGRLKGNKKIEFALELSRWAGQQNSPGIEEELINDVLELAKETSTEAAALLLGEKAYFNFVNSKIIPDTDMCTVSYYKISVCFTFI